MSDPTLNQALELVEEATQVLGKIQLQAGNWGVTCAIQELIAERLRSTVNPNTLRRLMVMGIRPDDAMHIAETFGKLLIHMTAHYRMSTLALPQRELEGISLIYMR